MKEWWQDFFIPVIGEVMFTPKTTASKVEVAQIIKQTGMRRGSRILDLACGIGRHSIEFAKRDFEVVGFDFSKPFLSQAKKSAARAQVQIKFIEGDMKKLKPHFEPNSFDLVTSLFNSFGYFKNRKDDLQMLHEVYRVLKPGGKFVLNTLNGEGVRKVLTNPISNGREPIKDLFIIDAASFDQIESRTRAHWTIIDARKPKTKIHRMEFRQNVYTHRQLRKLLNQAGFKIDKSWGMLSGGSFDPKSTWHQTILAKK